MTKKILLFGGNGWLGSNLASRLKIASISTDIAKKSEVRKAIDLHRPDVIINAAAKTGKPNIDWCETNKEETYRSNVLGPSILGNECARRNIYFIQLSTGFIFDGKPASPDGFTEEDTPNPQNYYAETKVEAEKNIDLSKASIIRMHQPIDYIEHERNLLTKLSKAKKVMTTLTREGNEEVRNSIIVLDDLVAVLDQFAERQIVGRFNIVNPQPISNKRILEICKTYIDPTHTYESVSGEELLELGIIKTPRQNIVLDTKKAQSIGIILPKTENSVKDCAVNYGPV